MAIRKIKNLYYIYFKDPKTKKQRTLPTGTDDISLAKKLEIVFMANLKAYNAVAKINGVFIDAPKSPGPVDFEPQEILPAPKRRLSEAITIASKYKKLSPTGSKDWERFCKYCNIKTFNELTPKICTDVLNKIFGLDSPKAYNNMLSSCNQIFKLCLVDVGLNVSPFSLLPRMQVNGNRQRAFTEDEFKAMLAVAEEPFHTAMLISWFTGLRKKDAFSVGWVNVIEGDVLDLTPFKTSNKGIRVFIPIHPQLLEYVTKWKGRHEPWTMCAKPINLNSGSTNSIFCKIMQQAGIKPKKGEQLNFNCIRNSYIDRMANFGVPEDIRKQIVGHTQTKTHDHYRGFIQASRIVQNMPSLNDQTV